MENRLARQISFFGDNGQQALNAAVVTIIGVGGVGSHIAQQLAFLNVGTLTIIDHDVLEETNFNRLIGVKHNDPIGTPKVEIVNRSLREINANIVINQLPFPLINKHSFEAIRKASAVFGCVDNDGARLVLNELCLAYEIPYIDVASDILKSNVEYGGRVIVVDKESCLFCLGEIDTTEARRYLQDADARKKEAAIYGVEKTELTGGGPSVVSINGVVASLAVTEFVVQTTGLRPVNKYLTYRGSTGTVTIRKDKGTTDCYYCNMVRGQKSNAKMEERYLQRGRG